MSTAKRTRRTRTVVVAVAEGAALHLAITAGALTVLTAWARLCEHHRTRGR